MGSDPKVELNPMSSNTLIPSLQKLYAARPLGEVGCLLGPRCGVRGLVFRGWELWVLCDWDL